MKILVLGATGNTGSAIVNQLKAKKADFGILNTKKESAALLNLDENQIRIGDFNEIDSLISAFQGVQRIYLLTPIHAKATEWVKNVIAAAKEAGVKHIVKQSGLMAAKDAKSEVIRQHAIADELLIESGIDYTLIQPNTFYQNFYGNLGSINGEGRFYSALGDAKLSYVDIHDVAAVAAVALTEEGHAGKKYNLTGPEALSSTQHAEFISQASGKEVAYIDVPKEALVEALNGAGLGEWLSDQLGDMISWFKEESNYGVVTNTVETILGRQPRSFSDFAKELAASIEGGKASE